MKLNRNENKTVPKKLYRDCSNLLQATAIDHFLLMISVSISAEMLGFELLDPTETVAPPITPLMANLTLSNLQRGHFEIVTDGNGHYTSSIYVPPTLALYTKFSLQSHFLAFWMILFLQILTIFITDKVWTRNIPESATIWEQLMHANLKSHFPLPFTNWHEGDGNCNDHVKRHKAANHEFLVTTAVNLLFNLIMLTPLVILCKL